MPRSPSATAPSGATALARSPSGPPPASYGELLALDGAARVRLLAVPAPARTGRLGPSDRELLAWLAGARCALTSQIHRRLHPARSLSVTQRQLLIGGELVIRESTGPAPAPPSKRTNSRKRIPPPETRNLVQTQRT